MVTVNDLVGKFVDGVLATPASIASGFSQVLGTVGVQGARAAQHHSKRLGQFAVFLEKVTFSDGVRTLAQVAVERLLEDFPQETIDALSKKGVFFAGKVIGSRAIAATIVNNIVKGAEIAEQKAMASRVGKIVTLLNVAHFVAESEQAADRLERIHPELYKALDEAGLVGGYFLIEDEIEHLLTMAFCLSKGNKEDRAAIHSVLLDKIPD